jgi:hypothetical protein
MKSVLTSILFVFTVTFAFAQKINVKGQLLDSLGSPLPSATVLLLSAKDSSLVNFGVTDTNGFFEIKNVKRSTYIFKVTFLGFKSFTQQITPDGDGSVVELGEIKMEVATNELRAIEVEAEHAPVTVKHDTIEFNAGSFKTKPNAVVEDLLKKLPGVEIDNDGNITAQGEQVRNVTVDGKNFFGSDPKLATRNLPADAINKVQVFDKKSDQTAFSGIDDGQRQKTINLELKEEKRNGAFGSMMAGAGTDERYQARANLNRFSKEKQFSFLGMSNNINEQGFSMDEYMNFTGGSQQMMSGGGAMRIQFDANNQNGIPLNFGNRANGIMSNNAAGINFSNEFTKNTEVNGSYFFNNLDHNINQTTERENFLPNGSFTFKQTGEQHNTNVNHRINVVLDQKIDSANTLKLTTNATYNETETYFSSVSKNVSDENSTTSESERLSISNGTSVALNAALLWRHKFNKKGRTFSTNLQYGLNDADREGTLDAENTFYVPLANTAEVAQRNQQETNYNSYATTVSYTEPLGKRKYLEANYSFRQNLNKVEREVYDINRGEENFNAQLSNNYSSDYQYHRAGLNFRIARSAYNFLLGASVQQTDLNGNLKLRDVDIDRSFQNILPTARFSYDFSNTRHLRLDYETSVQEPTIQQLQPVVDNSDPVNLYVGNPNLRPAYSQSWRLNFTAFDPITFINFFSFVDVDYTTNAITNAQDIDEQFVRTTTPVNVACNLSINSDANFGFPIEKLGSRIHVGGNYRNQRTIALLNDQQNEINQNTFGSTVRYTYRYKESLEVSLSADLDRQLTRYKFNQPDQRFNNTSYSVESNWSFSKNYQFSGSLNYLIYESKSNDFSQKIPLLNLSISRFLLKNKSGELKLAVNNLLNKALGISQTADINYIERQTTNSLGRYFMISFTYALNKQLNPMGMRRGGMMRIRQ